MQTLEVVLRRYQETTLTNEKIVEGVAQAMRVGEKEKNMKLYVKMFKLLTMANFPHRDGFLEEVSSHVSKIMHSFFLI